MDERVLKLTTENGAQLVLNFVLYLGIDSYFGERGKAQEIL